MRYAVVIERGENNYSAYVPDLPGCVSVGDTLEEVKAEIREAIAFHLDGMREDGMPIPQPMSRAEYVELDAPGEYAAEKARPRDAKTPAPAHVGRVLRPQSLAPRSGIYEEIGPRGGRSGEQAESTRGKPLPPTTKAGSNWELRKPAVGSGLSTAPKRGRHKEV